MKFTSVHHMKAIALSATLASSWLAASLSASAQVIPDGTVNTLVTPRGNTFTIDGGTTARSNLFHTSPLAGGDIQVNASVLLWTGQTAFAPTRDLPIC